MTTTTDLDGMVSQGLAGIAAAGTLAELDAAVTAVTGRRGALTAVQRSLGGLDDATRRDLGQRVNQAREALRDAEAARRGELTEVRDRVVLAAEAQDVTLPPRTPAHGSLHPIVETMEAMVDAFVGLGYRVVQGPEVESDWFNFGALNYGTDHPARSLHDTIYVRPLDPSSPAQSTLLRTHTSPMQVRTMLAQPPPVFVVVPGRTYRQDTADATHQPVFHQLEGLAVDAGLSFADLRGTLGAFVRDLLGAGTRIRLRPHYFPFTEPSCEVEAFHQGRWMELLGAGMVHPNVLRGAGYDPEEVSGFAFGMGIDRIAMLRHGVSDLRLFADNDVRFLASTA